MAACGLPQELMTKQLSSSLQADASKFYKAIKFMVFRHKPQYLKPGDVSSSTINPYPGFYVAIIAWIRSIAASPIISKITHASCHTSLAQIFTTNIIYVLAEQATLGELNINTNKPKSPKYSVYGKRFETYKNYSNDNPVSAKAMCEAGFFYEGDGDKVKCFWCDGALEMWSQGDEPWVEHAK